MRAGRQAEELRRGRQRDADHQRPLPHRARRQRPAHRIRAAPGLLGARPRRAPWQLQLRPRRLPLLQGRRGLAWRPSRPASSTSSRSTRRGAGCASTPGRSGATAASKKEVFVTGMGQGMQAYLMNLRRPMFQDRRVREALDLAYDFECGEPLRRVQAHPQPVLNSDFAAEGLPGPGELALLEPFRAQLPPEVFGPPYQPPRSDTVAVRHPRQPAPGARPARRGRLDARQRRRAAQRRRASPRVRVPDARGRRRSHDGDVAQEPGKARHRDEDAARRLRALPQAPGGLRLRHGGDRRRASFTLPSPIDYIDTLRLARAPMRPAATTSAG